MRRALALASLVTALACGDEQTQPDMAAPSAPPSDTQVTPTPDAGGVPSAPIPLVLWVDDLIDRHTNDLSAPDTVHDKNIADDENPATFSARFPK